MVLGKNVIGHRPAGSGFNFAGPRDGTRDLELRPMSAKGSRGNETHHRAHFFLVLIEKTRGGH